MSLSTVPRPVCERPHPVVVMIRNRKDPVTCPSRRTNNGTFCVVQKTTDGPPRESRSFHLRISPTPVPAKVHRLSVMPPPCDNQLSIEKASLYRFRTSVAQPSIPSPRPPTSSPSILTPLMPGVSSNQACPAIPPAFALFSGTSSSIGDKKSAILLASSSLKWYFSRRTSGNAQCRRRWMLRSSPFLLKISWDHFPLRHSDLGNGPRSSMICAMWSSSLPYLVPD